MFFLFPIRNKVFPARVRHRLPLGFSLSLMPHEPAQKEALVAQNSNGTRGLLQVYPKARFDSFTQFFCFPSPSPFLLSSFRSGNCILSPATLERFSDMPTVEVRYSRILHCLHRSIKTLRFIYFFLDFFGFAPPPTQRTCRAAVDLQAG